MLPYRFSTSLWLVLHFVSSAMHSCHVWLDGDFQTEPLRVLHRSEKAHITELRETRKGLNRTGKK